MSDARPPDPVHEVNFILPGLLNTPLLGYTSGRPHAFHHGPEIWLDLRGLQDLCAVLSQAGTDPELVNDLARSTVDARLMPIASTRASQLDRLSLVKLNLEAAIVADPASFRPIVRQPLSGDDFDTDGPML